jgi:dTDP-4-amino-4,6-dideoxygalactose transaminase
MNIQPALLGNKPVFESKIQLARPLLPSGEELTEKLQGILQSGIISKGPHLRIFEKMVGEHLGVKHAVAVSSCTSGLMLTYKCLGLAGEVIVPSFTFMATVSALIWAGLRPVFADVQPDTTNLDPAAVEDAITKETTAVVAVHNSGNPADIDALLGVTERYGLSLIFDAAHGFGSLYQGKPLGRQGDASVFSLSPTKLLATGEGGIVATNDDALANQLRIGREYGNDGGYDSVFPGLNARMPEFNALLGQFGLLNLEFAAQSRNLTAQLYKDRLSRLPGLSFQKVQKGDRNSYKDFSIIIDAEAFGLSRDELALTLAHENIDTRKYYDPPVHRQSAYRQYAPEDLRLLYTDMLASEILNIPIWSDMDSSIVTGICSAIESAHEYAEDIRSSLLEKTNVVA